MDALLSVEVCSELGWRIYHRVWQLYVAHVFFVHAVHGNRGAYLVDDLNNSIYAEEFRAADFLRSQG